MAEERQPWERMDDEPSRWFQRFELFRLQGPNRSIEAAYHLECEAKQRETKRPHPLWYVRAKEWAWKARAESWDKYISDQAAAEAEAERLRILSSGFALRHKRVKALNKLAKLLLKELRQYDRRWLPDVKQIGGGEFAERVDIERFNSAIIEQFRKTLDDIAAELGERVQGLKLSGELGVVNVTSDEMAKAAKKAKQFEEELLSDEEGSEAGDE